MMWEIVSRKMTNAAREHEIHEMRIPERDVTYIALSVYLITLIHRYALNRKQSH